MSFRTRLLLALLGAILIPLLLVALGVRREMERRLTAQYERRVNALADVMQADLGRRSRGMADRLAALVQDLEADNQFRLAMQGDQSARRRFFDYAGDAMHTTGLAMLQLEDSAGRIVSSGHFRNAFDRLEPELPALLNASRDSTAIVRVATADGSLLALARVETFAVAGRSFSLIGGTLFDSATVHGMSPDPELGVTLVLPGQGNGVHPDSLGSVVRQVGLPYLDFVDGAESHPDTARLIVTQSLATLTALRQSVDLWFLVALAVAALAAIPAALILSARISQPLRTLAAQTASIDLERLDQDFTTNRPDEIGTLASGLGAMMARLRSGAQSLREAERRATVGDLSRQINHDIKNGLIPIRNVVRHLNQVARDEPDSLPGVFNERSSTLDSSIAYLDTLARNYAKLSPDLGRQPCDVNGVLRELARDVGAGGVSLQLGESLPNVRADPLVLRRIFENLVGNAVESLEVDATSAVEGRGSRVEKPGVTVSSGLTADHSSPSMVRVVIADTGRGMSKEELDRAFDDFYTTKSTGTGLGLSIVRRLILDLGGSIRVETEPGRGTTVRVELPTV